jgi:hypothetical protein
MTIVPLTAVRTYSESWQNMVFSLLRIQTPFHIFHVLDTLLFGRLEAAKKDQPHDPDLNFQQDHIT